METSRTTPSMFIRNFALWSFGAEVAETAFAPGAFSLNASRGLVYKSFSCCGNIAYMTACSSSSFIELARSSWRSFSMPGPIKSAGRQLMGSFFDFSAASFWISGSTGAGVRPYYPRAISIAAGVNIFHLPNFTFIIACVPTICEVGVTRGIQPSFSRT